MSEREFKAGGLRHRIGIARMDVRYYGRRRRWRALLRVLWNVLLRGHYTESCQECGRAYNQFLWWSPEPLWRALTGHLTSDAGGLLCPACFDRKARAAGYSLTWMPMVTAKDRVPTTNWWNDPTRDALLMGEPDPDYFPDEKVRVPQPTWARIREALPGDFDGVPLTTYPRENCAP